MAKSNIYIVVLGGGINPDGSLPKHQFSRLDKSIELLRKNPGAQIITCGKYSFLYGKNQPAMTEAQAMENYLIGEGIDPVNIVREEDSKDTIGNAYYLRKYILKNTEFEKLIIITSEFHLERVKFIFGKFFEPELTEFVAVKNTETGEKLLKIKERQEYLLAKTREYLKDMKFGDLSFLDHKIYNTAFYKETRPDWVKSFVAKGK